MKILPALLLLLAGGIVACDAKPAKPPLEGTWEMTSATWTVEGKEVTAPSATISLSQLKMYSKGHFLFVGHFKESDKPARDNYGGGTYTLNGEDYTETILYHTLAGAVGSTLHFKLVVKGSTMTLTGPIVAEEQKSFRSQFTEVYQKDD